MTDAEVRDFLAEERVVSCASMGPKGRPHLVPLWYASEGLDVITWTYGGSQKVKNLERDPRATLQVEAGDDYDELRGVMMECDVTIERDPARVADYGLMILAHRGQLGPEMRQVVQKQAVKRVGVRFRPTRISSWDHRKL
jgi:PPOX class probable F420-dependent enzyme